MKATRKRIISSVLIFTMILSILPSFTVLAVDQQPEEDISAFVGVPALENVPFCVDEAVVSDAGHTVRLKYLEDSDNIAVFSNPDGTATKYIFSNPIKYIDDNGNYVDIDNTVETFGELTDDYKFRTKSAPATTYLPATIGMGEDVKVEHNGFSVQIIPMSDRFAAGTTVASELKTGKDSAVLYSNVFGAGRSLKYTTLYNGVKEDIILNSYIANSNSFNFILKTNGLELAEINGGYYFVDEEDTVIYELSPIFVYDSAEVPNTTGGTYAIEEIKPNDIYALTLTVDETWLSGATYPVTIDPTITYDDSDGLEDAFQLTGNTLPTGSANVLYVGNTGSSVARSFIKFPGLSLTQSMIDNLDYAKLHIKNYMTSQAPGIFIEAYNISSEWYENNYPTSLPYNSYHSNPMVTAGVTYNSWGAVDISSLITTWLSTSQSASASKGILLKVSNENEGLENSSYYAMLHSSEATNAADRPYLEIRYPLFDGTIVSFKSAASNLYMTVDKGYKYQAQNVFLQSKTDYNYNVFNNAYKFRVVYDQSESAYRFYPMCSMSGRGAVLDVVRKDTQLKATCNVDIWTPSDEDDDKECQLFHLISLSNGNFKIVLKSYPNLAITTNSTTACNQTGSASKSHTVAGNIYVDTLTNTNDTFQQWSIVEQTVDVQKEDYYSNMDVRYPFDLSEPGTPLRISSCFGNRKLEDEDGNYYHNEHWGLDIPASENTPVFSMFDGTVVEVGFDNDDAFYSRGNYVIVQASSLYVYGSNEPLKFCYMHLNNIYVEVGDTVTTSDEIGGVGSTGNSGGNHLHISIITTPYSNDIHSYYTTGYNNSLDPMIFFKDINFIIDEDSL